VELVSIITPCYNSEQFIERTVESIIDQTYSNWELLVIDDFSSDNSVNIVKRLIKLDSRIKLVQLEKNYGAAVARNKGIELAKGRFIAFLDSDDLWLPNKLKTQVKFMEKNNVSFSYSSYKLTNMMNNDKGSFIVPYRQSYKDILKTCSIGCLTAMYDVKKIGKVYMPIIAKRQDFGLWLRILKKVDYAYGIQEELAIYRMRKDSISGNKIKVAKYQWQIYRKEENLTLLNSLYYFLHYAINGLFKYR